MNYTPFFRFRFLIPFLCRTTSYCLDLASEQEKTIMEKWLPELRNGVVNAQKSLEDCKYVSGLVSKKEN